MKKENSGQGHRVCPWWVGHLLASRIRKLVHNPRTILEPFVTEGAVCVEPGPGMGFFTLDMARLAGPGGRVAAVDIQPVMLAALAKRAARAGVGERVETRLASGPGLGIPDLAGQVDFALVFYVAHEMPDQAVLFQELFDALKPGGKVLLAEPSHHVEEAAFARTLEIARAVGFTEKSSPKIRMSVTAVLEK
ncbi:MAG: methyltransferase domain-containing protein [Proteobacteria bacterium]|nr:methyltransferase domain-containing protein [Pseudomonadota bacterium]